jgi:hypothetical protein
MPKKSVDIYYYERPSPQDLLYEENDFYQNSYSGRSIYEWNIDGLNDKQIVDVTQKMLMYSTINKQQGNSDSVIAVFITTGFVGQLRGWWEFYLTDSQRKEILSNKKLVKVETTSSSGPVTVNSTGDEDAVYTLCLSILQNFVGNSVPVGERIATLLQNLRCPSLTHFRWYKDTFLSRLFMLMLKNSIMIIGKPNLWMVYLIFLLKELGKP